MKTIELNRRQFLKTTGALIVSFNLFPPSSHQARAHRFYTAIVVAHFCLLLLKLIYST